MPRGAGSLTGRGLSRAQVAELLGVTDRTVSRMDGRQLHPTRAPDRVWRYDPAEVRGLLLPPTTGDATVKTRLMTDGETTAAVFALIEQGKSPPQIVIATKQTAEIVNHLRAEYDFMAGSLVLPKPTVVELGKVLGADLRSAHGLVDIVRRALDARFEDGRAEAEDFGEVLDPATGALRKLAPIRTEPTTSTGEITKGAKTNEEGRAEG